MSKNKLKFSQSQAAIYKRNRRNLNRYLKTYKCKIGIPPGLIEKQIPSSLRNEEIINPMPYESPMDCEDVSNYETNHSCDNNEHSIAQSSFSPNKSDINYSIDHNNEDNGNEDIDDDDDDDDDDNKHDGLSFNKDKITGSNLPLISKTHISIKDHILAVVAHSMRYKSSYESMLGYFEWLKKSHYPNSLPSNKQALWKALSRNDCNIDYHYYCSRCYGYLGMKNPETDRVEKSCSCQLCGPECNESNMKYFLHVNLISQIKLLLTLPNVVQSLLKYRTERQKKSKINIEDVYDGVEYQNLSSDGQVLASKYNFSLLFNTDGCQVTKSSNASAWPIFAEIMELPPHMRKKYMLLAGVFVDTKHPLMNDFLYPFISEMEKLYTDGITWKLPDGEKVKSKIIVTIWSVDAPARASITRMTKFNGSFSCIHCYVKGDSHGRGKFIYPIEDSFGELRTHEELKADMLSAHESGTVINGVKGISCLVGLPLFNLQKSVIIDSMHAVFLGVAKQHTKLLLENTHTPYYIETPSEKKIIDSKLLSIKPPSRRSRAPRSIETYKKWKASEWRNWLDYGPFCLQNVLNEKYVLHFAQLSEAIHYLNSDSITFFNLNRAELLLKRYVKRFEEYFGVSNMGFNVHSLIHLTETVRNWGPLWVHNTFVTEAWNKKLIDSVTSPYARAEQIVTRFLMARFIDTISFDTSISHEAKEYISSLSNNFEEYVTEEKKNKFIGLGKSRERLPNVKEKLVLSNADIKPIKITCFQKVISHGIQYCCQSSKIGKFNNSIIYLGNRVFGIIVEIIHFYDKKYGNVSGFLVNHLKHVEWAFKTKYIHKVTRTEEIVFIRNSYSIQPSFSMIDANGSLYCIKIANKWETD